MESGENLKMIRILHIVSNMQQGGIENFIMNIYRNIDRNKIQFDFLVHYKKRFYFDDEIEKMGGKIYRLSFMEDKNIFKYIHQLNIFFKNHMEYKVVHAHMGSLGGIYLNIAKKYNIPIRIAHSHGASHLNTLKGYIKYFMNKRFKYVANIYWACSTEAGVYMFGNKKKFEIIPNAINMEDFIFNIDIRNKVRKELNISDEIVIGNVGRFNLQKNHLFLLDIFSEIHKINPNTLLLLVGNGELEKDIKEKINSLKLFNNVKLLGIRSDVNRIYQAMDLFLMPSLFEGLPLTGVEAQTSKLRCFFSDVITKEVAITDNVMFIPLKLTAEEWAKIILNNVLYDRETIEIKNKRFDIIKLSKEIQEKYIKLYESSENYGKK